MTSQDLLKTAEFLTQKSREQAPSKDGIRRTCWLLVADTYPEVVEMMSSMYRAQTDMLDCEVTIHPVCASRKNDLNKILSIEVTGAWISETVPREQAVSAFCRVGRFPPQYDVKPSWYGVISGTEVYTDPADLPENPSHE